MTLAQIKGTRQCPICQSSDGRCREGDDQLIVCRGILDTSGNTAEWKFIGLTKGDGAGMFAPPRPEREEPTYPLPSLSAEERDRHYRVLLAQLALHPDDRADLKRRGLTPDQIERGLFRSVKQWQPVNGLPLALPGVLPGDRLNAAAEGYLCPVWGADGLIIGLQLRLRYPEDGCRYCWPTSRTKKHQEGPTSHLDGQLPITVARPFSGVAQPTIGIAEGILKPWIAAQKHQQIFIGAAGGNFDASNKHFKVALESVSAELGSKVIDFYPDGGAISNKQVKRQYQATWRLLEKWGYQVRVGWWNQLSKENYDIDELPDFDLVEWLSPTEWLALPVEAAKRHDFLPVAAESELVAVDHCLGTWEVQKLSANHPDFELLRRRSDDPKDPFVENFSEYKENLFAVSIFKKRTDFDIQVAQILEGKGDNTEGGLKLAVTQSLPGQGVERHEAIISSKETTKFDKFIDALKREVGRDLFCILKQDDLQRLLYDRRQEYYRNNGRTYRLIDRVGRQVDGVWVLSPDSQFDNDGRAVTEKESGWVWNPGLGIQSKAMAPKINFQSPEALLNLAKAIQGYFHPDIIPIVYFTCGFVAANLHWQEIFDREGCFPQMNLHGDPGGGKTTAARVATSPVGVQNCAIQDASLPMLREQAKIHSGIPIVLDDLIKKGTRPERKAEIENTIWSFYDGNDRKVFGNQQQHHTAALVLQNSALGEGNPALESRLIKIHVPCRPSNPHGKPALDEATRQASGGIGQLIALGYPKAEVDWIEAELLHHLHSSHARISRNLALVCCYAQKFCDLAGVDFDALDWAIQNLCPAADELETNKNSLTDYLEKLEILKSEGAIGEWNCVETVDRNGREHLVLHSQSVWDTLSKRFNPNYSRQTIERLAQERGAERRTGKFVDCKTTWQAYLTARAKEEIGEIEGDKIIRKPGRTQARMALWIPVECFVEVASLSASATSAEPEPVEEAPVSVVIDSTNSPRPAASPKPSYSEVLSQKSQLKPGVKVVYCGKALPQYNSGQQWTLHSKDPGSGFWCFVVSDKGRLSTWVPPQDLKLVEVA